MYLLNLKEKEKHEKLFLEFKQFLKWLLREKLDRMRWKQELRILQLKKFE